MQFFCSLHGSNLSGVSHPQSLQTVQLLNRMKPPLFLPRYFCTDLVTKSYYVSGIHQLHRANFWICNLIFIFSFVLVVVNNVHKSDHSLSFFMYRLHHAVYIFNQPSVKGCSSVDFVVFVRLWVYTLMVDKVWNFFEKF